jgi:hypothetical protein
MKLAKVQLDYGAITGMSREQLKKTWAELIATGRKEPKLAAKALGYDVDLERWRLDFEIMEFERETAKKNEARKEKDERLAWQTSEM